ncbi:hypothetical protein [Curtobacterium sp. MCBD17_026]|uniref:hypothetical protein n=1 Tax=Curtobacterium sp. MCBD17_026 TaxID=2175621 RepID=UPI000DA8FCAB|nr:hypothetical protein [Curtobacterium sp. MCBD17_026]WIB72576.1 hypothetical protein DEI85_17450 [Curtobacterium sp. MCBD17_026]
MARIHIKRLAELKAGDQLIAVDGQKRHTPLTVQDPLGYIGAGDVQGVRFVPPAGSELDWVFYPGQMDGQDMEVERPE